MHDCAGWTSSCLVMGHLSLAWLLRDAVPGLRRSLLTVQMDDLFLTTGERQQVGSPRRAREPQRPVLRAQAMFDQAARLLH